MPRKLTLVCFSIAIASLGASIPLNGAALSGTVQDPQSKPVAGAVVRAFPRDGAGTFTTTTNSDGGYHLDDLPSGEFLISAEAPNLMSKELQPVRLRAGENAIRDIQLALASVSEQVIVTASGTAQSYDEITKDVTSISNGDAVQRDAFSLADTVAQAPAVRPQQLGGPGQLTSIRIRGLRDQDTTVLVDGMRLREASAIHGDSTGLIQDILLTGAGRVEVMNGAGSSLYGTGAIGGVVNILTDEGGGRARGSILAEGGSLGMARARATLAGGFAQDRAQYSLAASHVNYVAGADGDDPFRDTNVQGRLAYRFAPAAQISARVLGADSFAKLNGDPSQTGVLPSTGIVPAQPFLTFIPGPDDPDSTRAGRFLAGALAFDSDPSANLHYRVAAQILASGRRYGDGPAGPGAFQPQGSIRTLYDSRIQTVTAQASYRAGIQFLTGGYEFENENYAFDFSDARNRDAANAVNATQRSQALFAQDQVRLLDGRLLLIAGFRAQYFQLDSPSLAPAASSPYAGAAATAPPAAYTGDASAAYFFRSSGTKIRAHAGRGYRAPSLYERFGSSYDSLFGYSYFGDPRLSPEHSAAFDGGIDQNFGNGRATLSATYFYARLQDTVAFGDLPGTDPFGRAFGYLNSKGGLARGVEFSARFSPARSTTMSAAYTFVNAMERAPLYDAVLRTMVIPRNQFSGIVTQRVGTRLLLTLDTVDFGNYLAPIFGDFVNTFDTRVYEFKGLRRLNAGVSYRLPLGEGHAIRFYARGENLIGQDYYESGYITPGRTGLGGLQFEF